MNNYAVAPNILNDVLPQLRQFEASTGRSASPRLIDRLLQAHYAAGAQQAQSAAALEENKRQFNVESGLKRDELGKLSSAAKTSGAIQLGSTAVQLGMLGHAGYLGPAVQGYFGGPTAPVAASSLAAPSLATAPATAGLSLGTPSLTAGIPAGQAALTSTASTGSTVATAAGAAESIGPANFLAPAAAGFTAGSLTGAFTKDKKISKGVGIGVGVGTGIAMGSMAGPPGMVIGGVLGGLGGLGGGSK